MYAKYLMNCILLALLAAASYAMTTKEMMTQRSEALRLFADDHSDFVDVQVGNATQRLRRLELTSMASSIGGYATQTFQQNVQGFAVQTVFIDFTLKATSSMDVTKYLMSTESTFTSEFRSKCKQTSFSTKASASFIFKIIRIGASASYSQSEQECANSLSQHAKDDLKEQFDTVSAAFEGNCAVSGVTVQFSTPSTPFRAAYTLSTFVYAAGDKNIEILPSHEQLVWDPYRVEDLAGHLTQDDISNANRVLLGMLQDASSKVTGVALSTEQSNQYNDCEVKTSDPNYNKCTNDHSPHDDKQPDTNEDVGGDVVDKEEGRRKRCELQIRASKAAGSTDKVKGCEDFY